MKTPQNIPEEAIFLTVSHPRPVTIAKSVTVIIPHRLSTKAWSRYVYQT